MKSVNKLLIGLLIGCLIFWLGIALPLSFLFPNNAFLTTFLLLVLIGEIVSAGIYARRDALREVIIRAYVIELLRQRTENIDDEVIPRPQNTLEEEQVAKWIEKARKK
jgi:hypothetical protein